MIRALKRHTCGKCNFSTSRKFNLVRHFERKHQTQSTFNGHKKQGKRAEVEKIFFISAKTRDVRQHMRDK